MGNNCFTSSKKETDMRDEDTLASNGTHANKKGKSNKNNQ